MWSDLIWICVGILIGWNLPQPDWAKSLQDKAVAAIKRFVASLGGGEDTASGDRPRSTDASHRRNPSDDGS